MPHTNTVELVPNQGWDERILVCRNGDLVDTFIVVTARYVVLVDTVINPTTARQMVNYAQPYLTNGRQLLVINTHADYDHAWGNQLFAGPQAEFPAPIIATRLCAEQFQDLEVLAHLQQRQAREPAIFNEVVLTPPTLLFEERLRIDGGDLTLELFATPGHTPDHLAIYIPEIATLLAADGGELPFPLARTVDGLPVMRQSLARMAALNPKTVLYCHAPVTIGPQLLHDNLAYFDALEAHCRTALAHGVPADPPAEADVAALVDFPFEQAVQVGEYGDFLNDHHRTAWHPQQIRMMLTYLAQAG
ncbi:MAG: MBL fold metallo-hydrolase [Caldilinea sp. CFX5]|nr:MBL fold metallo-hydrolase [Caldilinea sp. CFX5]